MLGNAPLDRDCAAHRVNDASELDQDAVAGYSFSGQVCFGLRIDHLAEEDLERLETSTDCAVSAEPLRAQRWPDNSIRLSRIDWLCSAKRACVWVTGGTHCRVTSGEPTHAHLYH